MKKIVVALLSCIGLFAAHAENIDTIPARNLELNDRFTTNLIFSSSIFKVDIGTGDIIGKKIGVAGNILLLKAARKNFVPTNLTIYLADGRLCSFIVSYADSLRSFNYTIDGGQPEPVAEAPSVKGSYKRVSANELTLSLCGMHVKDDLLWLQLKAINRCAMPCKGRIMHCSVVDKRRLRRSPRQAIEIEPHYASPPTELGFNESTGVSLVLKPLVLPAKKRLLIEWGEPDGRRVTLMLKQKDLKKVR